MTQKAPHRDYPGGADLPQGEEEDSAPLRFPGCPQPTLGVELEVSLVDKTSRNLAPQAGALIAELEDTIRIKPELFQSIVELNTNVCTTVGDVRNDLSKQLETLRAAAAVHNVGLISTGTHPFADWSAIPISEGERYQGLVNSMSWPARRLLICGMHVHVGVQSGEHAIALMNSLTTFLPHLLALSASSPFWKGRDSGLASARIKIFEGLPTAGLPPSITNWSQFVELMHTLIAADAIRSIREQWWDIRPHNGFGTLEIRICDGVNTMSEICAITAFIQCLVASFQQRYDDGLPLPWLQGWTIKENKWRGARYGANAQLIRNERGDQISLRDHILEIVDTLLPTAEELQCESELLGVRTILDHGASSDRQRAIYDKTGSMEAVVDSLMDELEHDRPTTA